MRPPRTRSARIAACAALLLAAPARAAAPATDDAMPDALRGLSQARRARLVGAWGGYALRGAAQTVAIAPDGRRAVSGERTSAWRLWDLETGKQLRVVRGLPEKPSAFAFAPDGRMLAVGTADGSVTLWDAAQGRALRTLGRSPGLVAALAFSGDGRLVAAGGEDGRIRVWTAGSGKLKRTLAGHQDWVRALGFLESAEGRLLSASDDGTVRVWDLEQGTAAMTLGGFEQPEVTAAAVSSDGRLALVGEEGRGVRLWDLEQGATVREPDPAGRVLAVALSADGTKAAAVVTGRTPVLRAAGAPAEPRPPDLAVRQLELTTGRALTSVVKSDHGLASAAISRDAERAITAERGALWAWNLGSGEAMRATRGHSGQIQALSFSADGRLAVSGARDGTARVWEVSSGRELALLDGYGLDVRGVALSPDAELALASDVQGNQKLWSVSTGTELRRIGVHRGLVTAAFSADGRQVITSSYERVALWDLAAGKELGSTWFSEVIAGIDFSPDRTRMLVAGGHDPVELREVSTGRVLTRLQLGGRFASRAVLVPVAGRALVATSPSRKAPGREMLELFELESGRRIDGWAAPGPFDALAASPDGRFAAAAGRDGRVRLVDLRNRRELDKLDLSANDERGTALAFSPKSDLLLVGTSLGAVLQFHLEVK